MIFTNYLIDWYLPNKRDLPWRNTKDPYLIWLSEIILQQTKVAQGMSYFNAFSLQYPTVQSLAKAEVEEVLKLWQGLGYYSRARNLHTAANYIVKELDGVFPKTHKEILKLKGVGDYTASAIASFAYDLPHAVLDGNVYRVLSRYFGIHTEINSSQAFKEFKSLAQQLIDPKRAALFNQAIMEYGALVCTPKKPFCTSCGIQDSCVSIKEGTVSLLPKKKKKAPIVKRFFNYLVLVNHSNTTFLLAREGKGIWQGLYEFPLLESTKIFDFVSDIESSVDVFPFLKDARIYKYNTTPIIHKLSHQHIYTTFWIVDTEEKSLGNVSFAALNSYPVPKLIDNFLQEFSVFQKIPTFDNEN